MSEVNEKPKQFANYFRHSIENRSITVVVVVVVVFVVVIIIIIIIIILNIVSRREAEQT